MTLTTTATHRYPIVPVFANPRGRPAVWRALIAFPATAGSVLLLGLLLGWLGPWEGVALAAWLACSALVVTRVGERVAVTVTLGFGRPTPEQAAALDAVWSAALRRAGLCDGDVDLYVHRSSEPNAYAAGSRSVAVTRGLLREFVARRLSEGQMQALLLHELGHLATGATTGVLPAAWLALPWRLATRVLLAVTSAAARRTQPRRALLIVALAGGGFAVIQAVQQRHWSVVFVLGAVSFCVLVCPIADAAMARRSEYTADRYADALGYGPQLASALKALDDHRGHQENLAARTLHRHPSITRRILALHGTREPAHPKTAGLMRGVLDR